MSKTGVRCRLPPSETPLDLVERYLTLVFSRIGEVRVLESVPGKDNIRVILAFKDGITARTVIETMNKRDSPFGVMQLSSYTVPGDLAPQRPQKPPKSLRAINDPNRKDSAATIPTRCPSEQEKERPAQSWPDSRVLLVKGLHGSILSCRAVANLAGVFGNVVKVLVNTQKCYALVQMQTPGEMRAVVGGLGGRRICGQALKAKETEHRTLFVKRSDKEQFPHFELLKEDPKLHVFRSNGSKLAETPSDVLVISQPPKGLTPGLLDLLLEHVETRPAAPSLVDPVDHKSLVVRFASAGESLAVIAALHNVPFNNGRVRLGFKN